MFSRPPSRTEARRGAPALPTVSAVALLAFAGLAVGACSAPAAGREVPLQDNFDRTVITYQSSAAEAGPAIVGDSRESLRKEHMPNAAGTIVVTIGETQESLRQEHMPNAADTISATPGDSWDTLRQEHLPSGAVNGS